MGQSQILIIFGELCLKLYIECGVIHMLGRSLLQICVARDDYFISHDMPRARYFRDTPGRSVSQRPHILFMAFLITAFILVFLILPLCFLVKFEAT